MFLNLIKLYFLGTTQEDLNEHAIYLHKLEQLKLCNLICKYIYIYILKIQGPVGLRLWNEFSTFEYKNSPYIGARI